MTLRELLTVLGGTACAGAELLEREVRDLVADSRQVTPGAAFVAIRGERTDGHAYIAEAVAAGAVAVIVQEGDALTVVPHRDPPPALGGVASIVVPDTRLALSRLAAAFYGHPSDALRVIGVTGTNGKTTTVYLVQAILEANGLPTGRIGTLGAAFAGRDWPLENTTPLPIELQARLADFRAAGARAVAMEVSSHALALARVEDVRFEVGVFTNLTRDHLDFHGDMERYAAAKRRLFELARVAVINADDRAGAGWIRELRAAGRPVMAYGIECGDVDVRGEALELGPRRSRFSVDGLRFEAPPGRFNVANALAALCVARSFGVADQQTARALAAFSSVPGRMQLLRGGDVDVIVDYAHTPDALANVLGAARELVAAARGRVVAVFGCGGDRDRGKRPAMGRTAAELADAVIVTSDNPRSEPPERIAAEIVAGIPAGAALDVVLDRRAAIRHAIDLARPGDLVVIAGKGHEPYQIVGAQRLSFDDAVEARAALATRQRPPAPASGGSTVGR